MPDAYVKVRAGEKRPVFGQAVAASGTLTIEGVPACTLYDAVGAVVSGYAGISVTGYDTGALASPRVWLDLDTASPTTLAAGFYTLVFAFSALGSDGISRTFEPAVEVQVLDARA